MTAVLNARFSIEIEASETSACFANQPADMFFSKGIHMTEHWV